jgi:hypothetical protein
MHISLSPSTHTQSRLIKVVEVDKSEIKACDRLEARHPDAQIWIVRVGSRHVRRFGGRTRKTT